MTLKTRCVFELPNKTHLILASGSILDFTSYNEDAAIVNAANETCLGGGGVDGAISAAGGSALFNARLSLPLLDNQKRCRTGCAVITGPGDFGELQVNYVIHAVGPNYNCFPRKKYRMVDSLLRGAYVHSLRLAQSANIRDVAFSLISSGVYRGERSLKKVLHVGLLGICEWASQTESKALESIVLCAFLDEELKTLYKLCIGLGLPGGIVQDEKENRKS
jgi:O-acetyl-ADP-ribose deacetylase